MIRRTVSAALLLRDGFSGRTLTGGTGTLCLLDGRPLSRPIWKQDGYLVLTDLTPGAHTLLLRRAGYRDEVLRLELREGQTLEDTLTLKPGPGYRFPPQTVCVTLRLLRGREPAAGENVWLGVSPRMRLLLAQERAEPGEDRVRLFCEGGTAQLPLPGHYLLKEDRAPELVYLRSVRDGIGTFAQPLTAAHPRGTECIPVQSDTADPTGTVRVYLPEPGVLTGLYGGRIFEAPVASGPQLLEWKLED